MKNKLLILAAVFILTACEIVVEDGRTINAFYVECVDGVEHIKSTYGDRDHIWFNEDGSPYTCSQ